MVPLTVKLGLLLLIHSFSITVTRFPSCKYVLIGKFGAFQRIIFSSTRFHSHFILEHMLTPKSTLLAPYSWNAGPISRNDVLDKDIFLWEDQAQKQAHIPAAWPEPEHILDMTWPEEEGILVVIEGEIQGKASEKESEDK